MSTMEFGLTVPNRGPLATPEAIGALVAKAEESGFVRFAVPDLVVVPTSYASRYPYDASGKLVGYASDCMEQLVLMAHVAAQRQGRALHPHRIGRAGRRGRGCAPRRRRKRLMFNFLRPTLEGSFAAIERFRENVMARLLP